MTSANHVIDWIDPRTGFGYYDDNPTRPAWCVPAPSDVPPWCEHGLPIRMCRECTPAPASPDSGRAS